MRHAKFVDFVQEKNRILRSNRLHPLHEPSQHRTDICAAVPTNVGLVPCPTQ